MMRQFKHSCPPSTFNKWHHGLTCKLLQPDRHTFCMIIELVGNCSVTLTFGNDKTEQVMAPQEYFPTGICPGTPSLQHLQLSVASHCLLKVCISWRPSNHACWWRLAGSGRGAEERHSNCRWIPPDLEAEAHNYKNSVGSLPSQEQGS